MGKTEAKKSGGSGRLLVFAIVVLAAIGMAVWATGGLAAFGQKWTKFISTQANDSSQPLYTPVDSGAAEGKHSATLTVTYTDGKPTKGTSKPAGDFTYKKPTGKAGKTAFTWTFNGTGDGQLYAVVTNKGADPQTFEVSETSGDGPETSGKTTEVVIFKLKE